MEGEEDVRAIINTHTSRYVGESKDPSVKYSDFNPKNLRFGVAVKREAKGKVPEFVYVSMAYVYSIPVKNESGHITGHKDREALLSMITPYVMIPRGVMENFAQEDTERLHVTGHSICIPFNLTNPEHVQVMQALIGMYKEVVRHLTKKETLATEVGGKLAKHAKNISSDEQIEEMNDPNSAWSGASFTVAYKKEGQSYNLDSTPRMYAYLKRYDSSPSLFLEKKYLKDKEGNYLLDDNDEKKYEYVEIAEEFIRVASLEGFCSIVYPGINVTSMTSKVKSELECMIVKKTDTKSTAVKKGLSEADTTDDSQTLADGLNNLLPEADKYKLKKDEEKRKELALKQASMPATAQTAIVSAAQVVSPAAAASAGVFQSPFGGYQHQPPPQHPPYNGNVYPTAVNPNQAYYGAPTHAGQSPYPTSMMQTIPQSGTY